MISWRGIAVWGFGALLYVALKERTLLGAIALEALPPLLIALDWLITPGKPMFSVRREGPPRYVIGRPNPIDLIVRNDTGVSVSFELRDDTPQTWVERRPRLSGKLQGGETLRVTYDAAPVRRGVHTFGRVHMRVRGRLGLVIRQFSFDAHEKVKVLPDVRQIKEEQLLARTAKVRSSDRVRRILPGQGTEFARVRDYTVDDDFRHVNWKATAKCGRPMVNEFEVTRNQTVLIAIDAGRLSRATLGGLTRLDHTINAAIRLAYVSVEAGDRVGLVVFADQILRTVRPDGGVRALREVVRALGDIEPKLVDSDYRKAFERIMQLHPRRSLLCLFTDVVESWTSEELRLAVSKTSKHHLITCISIGDPEVLQAAHAQPEDANTFFRKAAALEIADSRNVTLTKIARSGAVVVDAPPWALAAETINMYLALKARVAV